MSGDFEERMQHLIESVGGHRQESRIVVDQVYARYQEVGLSKHGHPLALHGGGQHQYTQAALFENLDKIMGAWADSLVTPDGSDIRRGGADVAEIMAQGVFEKAPFEFGDLKGSAAPSASDDGAEYYARPPAVHRLSEDELRAKGDLRRLGLGHEHGEGLHDALGNAG